MNTKLSSCPSSASPPIFITDSTDTLSGRSTTLPTATAEYVTGTNDGCGKRLLDALPAISCQR